MTTTITITKEDIPKLYDLSVLPTAIQIEFLGHCRSHRNYPPTHFQRTGQLPISSSWNRVYSRKVVQALALTRVPLLTRIQLTNQQRGIAWQNMPLDDKMSFLVEDFRHAQLTSFLPYSRHYETISCEIWGQALCMENTTLLLINHDPMNRAEIRTRDCLCC